MFVANCNKMQRHCKLVLHVRCKLQQNATNLQRNVACSLQIATNCNDIATTCCICCKLQQIATNLQHRVAFSLQIATNCNEIATTCCMFCCKLQQFAMRLQHCVAFSLQLATNCNDVATPCCIFVASCFNLQRTHNTMLQTISHIDRTSIENP